VSVSTLALRVLAPGGAGTRDDGTVRQLRDELAGFARDSASGR
jgi:hypothetical protein